MRWNLFWVFMNRATFGVEQTLWFPPKTKKDLREIVGVAKQFGVDFDTRSKLEIIAELGQTRDQGRPRHRSSRIVETAR